MEKAFKRNSLRPGQEGYQYDIQVNFNPKEENEWDMDLEEQADIV